MSMFRKKTPTPEEQAFSDALSEQFDRRDDDLDDTEDPDEPREGNGAGTASAAESDGPPRLDFGSILVPAVDGMQVRAEFDDDQNLVSVGVVLDDTVLQLQAFAAPRSEALWDEVRPELAEGIRGGQGKAREADGPFGREVQAEVVAVDPEGATIRQAARFIGIDGDRWFLRGVVTGAGATEPDKARAVEALFGEVEVVRGQQAAAPRDLLPLHLPKDSAMLTQEEPGR